MGAAPLLEEVTGGAPGTLIDRFAGLPDARAMMALELSPDDRPLRRLAIYPAAAGFDLVDELDHLGARAIEPNVFFNPRFLAPAMPRLEDREVRLAVMRDGDEERSRLRLLLPFSVERPVTPLGVPVMRTWSNAFGPLGTPLVDRDDPAGVIDDFLAMMARPHLKMPKVFVLPDIRPDGPFASILNTVAETRNLPLITTSRFERPFLQSDQDDETYLNAALSRRHYREFLRLRRRLGEKGALEYRIARAPEEIRTAAEAFLALEASGWKGRKRSAMAIDRYQAAFAREAIHRMAERDLCRIHMLTLDGAPIASLVVFVESGIAYAWKTAFDEAWSAYSPGALLLMDVTRSHLDDPNITATDSCAVPDHPVAGRMWTERRSLATLVLGLTPDSDRQAHQAVGQIDLYRESRNTARLLRGRLSRLLGRR